MYYVSCSDLPVSYWITDSGSIAMLSLVFNVIIPVIILTRFSGEDGLGPVRALLLALAFPLAFGLIGLARERRVGAASAIGLIGVLLTGGIGLLELDPAWVAVKEAAIPLALGLAIIASRWTRYPLVPLILDRILDVPRVRAALEERGTVDRFERLTVYATYLLGGAFFLSATLNFALARVIVTSQPGTAAFNEELGRMTALSVPVITVPVMLALFGTMLFLLFGTRKLTGLDFERLVRQPGG